MYPDKSIYHKIVFLFTGQGSHYRGMGDWLFRNNTVFRQSLERSDAIVRQQLNRSLIEELYFVKSPSFDELLVTHPSIIAVEVAMYDVLMHDLGIRYDYVAGSSLGEFAAAAASGVWMPETAVEAAIEQAKSICREEGEGGMLAVIHTRNRELEALYHTLHLFLAADNFDGHFTLTGRKHDLDCCQVELNRMGIDSMRLAVAHPFHSPLIGEMRGGFDYYIGTLSSLARPGKGFVSGLLCEEADRLPAGYFWDVVSGYMDYRRVIRYMESKGPCLYVDLGPSGTGANFARYNIGAGSLSRTCPIMSPFKREQEQLVQLKKMLEALPIV